MTVCAHKGIKAQRGGEALHVGQISLGHTLRTVTVARQAFYETLNQPSEWTLRKVSERRAQPDGLEEAGRW
ncbi:protein of unknown function [Methylocaldum szegediense]|uniref:Transposase n=1 Tax=Methylocaldum szegediense TaxID=73780 RepID=A0ABN8X434_9GAMM|nr:protein of unknown function [Methylocaldum szegediense]